MRSPSPNLTTAVPTELLFATAVSNPTATSTPFQPFPGTETEDLTSLSDASPTPLPTDTQVVIIPTNTLAPGALSPTFDPNSVLPTVFVPTPIFAPKYAPAPFPLLTDNETVTFALLGSDSSSGISFRTDTIIIAAIRPKSGQVTLISIPRDLWVYIPNFGMDRINTAYERGGNDPGGGPTLLKDTILYNLGIRIDHTALLDFDGFRRIVDTLGGVDVPVACPYTDWHLIDPSYDPENKNNWSLYTVGPGVVHMDGNLALWYARSRQKSNDFDRGRRSQEVLRALFVHSLRTNTITKLPQLYNDLYSTVTTDLGLVDILKLAPLALNLSNANIRSYYIGSEYITPWITSSGASVLLPNNPAIQAMLQLALAASPRAPDVNKIRVEIRNGTPNSGWDALAAARLNYAGYETLFAQVDRTDYPTTRLYDQTATQDPNRANALLAILGLPQIALFSVPNAGEGASYILILGADYLPCFNPVNLAP